MPPIEAGRIDRPRVTALNQPSDTLAELRNVTMQWGDNRVLDAVDLSLRRGEQLVVVGPSGSGKSTILRLLAGLLRPTRGSVLIHGKPQRYLRLDQHDPPD
ncbi:MAG: ATP-binding cassette domain-containing protein, partial [Prochlorococcaceae cyanobacterium]